MTRAPLAAALTWLPRVLAAITFAVYALVAPVADGDRGFAAIAGTADPITSVIAGAFAVLPVGTPAYRLQLASALGAALAVLLVARVVAAAGKDDVATVVGAAAAGSFAAACAPLVMAGTAAGTATWLAAALAGVVLLGHRVALGGDATDGLPAALLMGLVIAVDATTAPLAVPLLVLFALRLRRGARWPLATPAIVALALAAALAQPLVRAATGHAAAIDRGEPRDVAALVSQRTPTIAAAPDRVAPWLEASGDALGPLGLAAAAVGLIALWTPRSRWLAACLGTALIAAIAGALLSARPTSGALLAVIAAVLIGAGVARVARTIPIAVGQAAVGATLAVVIATTAALTSAHALHAGEPTGIPAAGP